MDDQKPLWRTAWYWKKLGLYVLIPLFVLDGLLAALTRTGHLSTHHFDTITTVVTALSIVAFTSWVNYQAQKRTTINNS